MNVSEFSGNFFWVSLAVFLPDIAERRHGISSYESMKEGAYSGIFSPKFVCNGIYSQGVNSVTVRGDSLCKLSMMLYEKVTGAL